LDINLKKRRSIMKYSNVRMSDEDREYLKKKYGTIQNAFVRMLENDKKKSEGE
jgi:hypothetical protein|tara:strand:+ start:1404 stop:1562 length:159 start_codon:yes stop_codon:yes gene_type:complete